MNRAEQLRLIDRLCDDFDCQLAGGQVPRIEDFLDRVATDNRGMLLGELLAIELDCEAGSPPDNYHARFPGHSTEIDEVFAEFRQRNTRMSDKDGNARETVPLPGPSPTRLGDYDIVRELARGGMGVVYQARHRTLDRQVAIKMILGTLHLSSRRRQRFLDEAKVVAHLQHPNIVQIFELGEHEGHPFIVFELVDGGSLAASSRSADIRQHVQLVADVSHGVEYAHRCGVIHRDIKPSNILLTSDGVPKVADFGLAKQLDAEGGTTMTGEVMGTPDYMAPEQARGDKDIDERVDVYALGAVLYELLTGQQPFRRDTAWATVNAVLTENLVSPRRHEPNVPVPLERIICKALEKDRERRYASAMDLATDLERWLDDQPVLAPPLAKRTPRRRWLAACLACLSAVPLFYVVFPHRNEFSAPQELTNSLGMELRLVPAGTFIMGAAKEVPGDPADQVPVHRVNLSKPIYIGCHEVTVGQFRAFVEATQRPIAPGVGFNNATGLPERDGRGTWEDPGWLQTEHHPVVNVSWEDAHAFCQWMSEKEGRTYRLPTEAEWEYACRAGTTTVYFTGDDPESLQSYANIADGSYRRMLETFNEEGYYDFTQSWNDGFPFTAPVGQCKPNPFGLYDMHGNVQEWCADWYSADYYRHSPLVDPPGPPSGETRVKRGGDWLDYVNTCRSSFRRSEVAPNQRHYMIGFRVVLVPP